MFVDTHAHLDDRRFDADRDDAVRRASDADVRFIINPGCDLESSRKAVALADRYDGVYATVGVHPHEADTVTDDVLAQLRTWAAHEKVVAIGEIGLDYYRDLSPRDAQKRAFRRQLDLAMELDLPVVLHSRDAHDDVERTLAEYASSGNLRGVLHCFSGDVAMAQRAAALGLHIGFDGPVTYKNAETPRAVAAALPAGRILIETDCPYLVPAPHKRSERNEPAYVIEVAAEIARVRGMSVDDIGRTTSAAAARLFGIPSMDEASRIAYVIRNSLYLNITNRCSNACTFCLRDIADGVHGHRLVLEREPTVDEIIAACGDVSRYDEVVFCGFGEPTERLDALKEVAAWLKRQPVAYVAQTPSPVQQKPRPGAAGPHATPRIRVVTNGQGDLINGRPIAAELAGLVDKLSVSVNTADAAQYETLCRSRFGAGAHAAVLKFVEAAKVHVPDIEISAVNVVGVDMNAVEALARKMGVSFRARRYNGVDNRSR